MTKEESLQVTGHIARVIAERAPSISYSPGDLKKARESYSDEKLQELKEDGFYFDDFELFYVMFRFCSGMDLWNRADEDYIRALFARAKKFDRKEFYRDSYLSQIQVPTRGLGNFLLTQAEYARGEFFQYDMPCLSDEIVVPKIGFFTQKVAFPAVYEGNMPWVSVCPSEIFSMTPDVAPASGRVLVLGLGLGYYPFLISNKEDVKEITIVEKSPEIIRLFREEILPQFPHREKICIEQEDAFHFLEKTEEGEFDFCYADIWEGWEDGARCYRKILPQEKRLSGCRFRYWIKNEILWYMEKEKEID